MVSPDFSTPVVAQSLAQTDNIVLAIDVQDSKAVCILWMQRPGYPISKKDVQDSSNLTTGLAYADQEKQHLVRKI
jgi:hypothetical protein